MLNMTLRKAGTRFECLESDSTMLRDSVPDSLEKLSWASMSAIDIRTAVNSP